MGDSITAATGANAINFLEAAVENRGLSFSIGGIILLRNIFHTFKLFA